MTKTILVIQYLAGRGQPWCRWVDTAKESDEFSSEQIRKLFRTHQSRKTERDCHRLISRTIADTVVEPAYGERIGG